jgi:hypothetical protein
MGLPKELRIGLKEVLMTLILKLHVLMLCFVLGGEGIGMLLTSCLRPRGIPFGVICERRLNLCDFWWLLDLGRQLQF